MASAENSARGTVRAGFFTSPLGTSATSTPTNAKIRSSEVLPSADAEAGAVQLTLPPRSAPNPAITKTPSGNSFAIVAMATNPTPRTTPAIWTTASDAKSAPSRSVRTVPAANAGKTMPTDPANALATDATANDAISQYNTPPRKP